MIRQRFRNLFTRQHNRSNSRLESPSTMSVGDHMADIDGPRLPLRYFKIPSQRTPVHGSRVKPTTLATMPFGVPSKKRPIRKSHGAKRVYRKKVSAARRTRCRNEQRAKARR